MLLLAAGGVVLVVLGAELLLAALLALARRLGVSAFALTAVISGVELENLAAGVAANLGGFPGAAIGTSLGGAVFLALAVTGLAGWVAPARLALPPGVSGWSAAAPLPLLLLSLDGRLSRFDGALLVLWFAVAVAGLARAGARGGIDDDGREPDDAEPDGDDDLAARIVRQTSPAVAVAGALALLGVGGNLLGEGLRAVAGWFPAAPTLLGNTALAAAVEAEEVARVAVPARRGRPELAAANVLGTIVHFVALNAGVIALVRPLVLDRATQTVHLPAAVLATVACLILLRARGGFDRPGGAALLALYALYLAVAVRWPAGL